MSGTEPKPPPTNPRQPTSRNPTQARQGLRAGRVIWVLVGGLVLVVIAYILIGTVSEHPPANTGVTPPVTAPSSQQPAHTP